MNIAAWLTRLKTTPVVAALAACAVLAGGGAPAAQAAASRPRAVSSAPAAWKAVAVPSSVHSPATLDGVSAASASAAWAVGAQAETAFQIGTPLLLHWNGKAWDVVKTGLGSGYLQDVQVSASGEVWVGGSTSTSNSSDGVVAREQDGTWKRLPSPGITNVTAVLGTSASAAWAAGDYFYPATGLFGPAVAQWNGITWNQQAVAANVVGEDLSVSPDSAGQAQWVGVEEGNSGLLTTLYAYYNGTAWSNVDGATATPHSPASTTVTAHIPGTDATWAVGGLIASTTGSLTPGRALIEYNP